MKLQKVKKALHGTNLIIFEDDGGFQWLSDGTAAYLMDRELDLTRGNLLAILDIEEDKRANYTVREVKAPGHIDQCPQEEADEQKTMAEILWMMRRSIEGLRYCIAEKKEDGQ